MKKRMKSAIRNRRGVALVFFLLVFGLLLSFTMVVVNTGMIIWQKMRLQMAVDMGAYAAASVASAYLGNHTSGVESIQAKNFEIREEYFKLIEEINIRPNRVGFPGIYPNVALCVAACNAFNVIVASRALEVYDEHKERIMEKHAEVRRILQQLPGAMQAAAEETIRLNIPELEVKNEAIGGAFSPATNDPQDLIRGVRQSLDSNPQNAVLTFSSNKGAYLANVVGSVPHRTVYFGPICPEIFPGDKTKPRLYYCTVNGAGAQGTLAGYAQAAGAWGMAQRGIGNIGKFHQLANLRSNAIPIHFVENPKKPKPFTVVSAEWYPEGGSFINFENSFGATGSLFPKQTRLVAVAAAEPFGGSLALQDYMPFGVRLAGIRKLLLDPKVPRDDFGQLYQYMETLAPQRDGQRDETAEEVIKRFLH